MTESLTQTLHQPVSSFTDLESSLTTVTAFLERRELWSETTRQRLQAELQQMRNCGLSIEPGRISMRKVESRDWAHAWKHHFNPFRVGSTLVVRPSWRRLQVQKGERVVVIDPGLSFGTGHHPTTRFCLEQLVAHRDCAKHRSFLDLGTGSGILAIAAAKLDYAPVLGLDLDPEAVLIARENARRNRLTGRITFRQQDIAKLLLRPSRRYSVVCANLITPLLLVERWRILAQLEQAGVLVLAGILKDEFAAVKTAYTALGLRLVKSKSMKEWCSGSFIKT